MNLAMHCGTPMIYTLIFRGAEFYCIKCGYTKGMFNIMEQVATDKLFRERKENCDLFAVASIDCIPSGTHLDSCEKCQQEEHRMHVGKEALDKSDSAYLALAFGLDNKKEETDA